MSKIAKPGLAAAPAFTSTDVAEAPDRQRNDGAMTPHDVARLAHELKTPLTAIAAAAEIMRDERLGPMANDRYRDYARDIHESAAHALAVIGRLLDAGGEGGFGRIERIDLNDLVQRTIATLQPMASERRLRLGFEPGKGRPAVTASATALRQVLLNLLSNALKFTPPLGEVRVDAGQSPDGRPFLAVRDTGVGIDEASVCRALNNAETMIDARAGGGQGIGLPLVCRLVADMGATIQFEGSPGRGTVVVISFAAESKPPR